MSGEEDEKLEHDDDDVPSTMPEAVPQPPPLKQTPAAPDANPIDPRTFWRP